MGGDAGPSASWERLRGLLNGDARDRSTAALKVRYAQLVRERTERERDEPRRAGQEEDLKVDEEDVSVDAVTRVNTASEQEDLGQGVLPWLGGLTFKPEDLQSLVGTTSPQRPSLYNPAGESCHAAARTRVDHSRPLVHSRCSLCLVFPSAVDRPLSRPLVPRRRRGPPRLDGDTPSRPNHLDQDRRARAARLHARARAGAPVGPV